MGTAKVNDNSAKLSLFSKKPNTRSNNSNNLSSTPASKKPASTEISDDSSDNSGDDDDGDLEDENILDYVTDNNDRFANIIERMDMLETENTMLKQQQEND